MITWPRTALLERLALDFPILQAPMAMVSHADLVVAVSNSGGLGGLGSALMDAPRIHEEVREIRARTHRAFALNFFVHELPSADPERAAALTVRLAEYRAELALSEVASQAAQPVFDDEMLSQVLALRPRAVSFHFGLPAAHAIAALKRADIFLLGTATTVAEALRIESAGFDAVVAQGAEAGGHRGTFAEPFSAGEIGLVSLVPQIVDAVRIPVVAAGGIADGRGIAAALMLGAHGVQIGTAFLSAPEAQVHPAYRRVLMSERARSTRLTRVYTGRPARAVVTRFMDEMADQESRTLAFPLQRAYTGPLGKAGLARDNPEFHSMWAGQSAPLCRPLGAAALLHTLVAETERALDRASR